jgi:chalcone isomerase-like protein
VRQAIAAGLVLALSATGAVQAQEVKEPKTGVAFAERVGPLVLLGVGLRVRSVAMIKVKVYALGLYVTDAAISGPLAAYKGKTSSPEFYRTVVNGEFDKVVTMKFVRDVDQSSIQSAMREALVGADKARVETFVAYFPAVKEGQDCTLRVDPAGVLHTTMAGASKPPIDDKAFSAAVLSIWLGEKPIQDDIKKDLVSRAPALIR